MIVSTECLLLEGIMIPLSLLFSTSCCVFVLQKASQTRAPLPLAELSIPILQEGIPTIQVVPAPAQFGEHAPKRCVEQ